MTVIQYFQRVLDLSIRDMHKVSNLKLISKDICDVQIEQCFNIDIGEQIILSEEELKKIEWLLMNPLDRSGLSRNNFLNNKNNSILIEIGPR